MTDKEHDPGWIEGLPTEPGTYWYFLWEPGTGLDGRSGGRVRIGTAGISGDGKLMHICGDILYKERIMRGRYWHIPVVVPGEPDFDRKCPDCDGSGKAPGSSWRDCYYCKGQGTIESPES